MPRIVGRRRPAGRGAILLSRRAPTATMRLLLVEDDRMIGDSLRGRCAWKATRSTGSTTPPRRDATLASRALRPGAARPRPAGAAPTQTARPTASTCCARCARASDATPVIVLTARDARRRPRRRPRRRRRRLPRQAVRARRAERAHPRRAAAPCRPREPVLEHGGVTLDPATRQVTLRRRAGAALGARVRGARGAAGAARRDAVAGAARGPALRLGRGDREQRGLGLRPPAAPQARRRLHPQRARRRLLPRRRRPRRRA